MLKCQVWQYRGFQFLYRIEDALRLVNLDPSTPHNVLIQGSVVVIRQFLIFINQTFLMVSVALVTMVD